MSATMDHNRLVCKSSSQTGSDIFPEVKYFHPRSDWINTTVPLAIQAQNVHTLSTFIGKWEEAMESRAPTRSGPTKTRVTIAIPAPVLSRLADAAFKRGISLPEQIRDVLHAWAEGNPLPPLAKSQNAPV